MSDQPQPPTDARAWAEAVQAWLDVIRYPHPLAAVIVAVLAIIAADAAWLVGLASADTAALLNGLAAIISAIAAVAAARRHEHDTRIADHEARLRARGPGRKAVVIRWLFGRWIWRTVRDTGITRYQVNARGDRRAVQRPGGYQPIDRRWLTTGEWSRWGGA